MRKCAAACLVPPLLQVCAVKQGGAFAEEVVVPAAATWHIPGEWGLLPAVQPGLGKSASAV